ncbi:response regulator [Draconibacterium halophilum]|uniref:Response regulator n=1 Tax=Draconibacterium halophilum TaxID=2706887 RepID=A0A6C0RGW0_9BACT|nr:response regulator [Draconibacterium halophilum]QIA09339.1 response regulator [Draconibacterium halophilum]
MVTSVNHETIKSLPAKIVLIEDNLAVSQWISEKIDNFENLKLAGSLGTHEGAFEMIKKEKPEFVILDIKLPDGSGLDILKNIREAKMDITVMILTLNTQAKNSSLRMGADYFFDKSMDTGILVEKLKSFNRSINPSSINIGVRQK